ncbi:DUF3613 domain-containing protein [Variovorax sp. H27-G14]|uniref:DUF3613 domain-containing protein n=1 Tax=Variovorax sp. H27-G14 TaxID=3111914 RepID=UPI0038FCF693
MKNRFPRLSLWPIAGLGLAMITTCAAADNARETKSMPQAGISTPSPSPTPATTPDPSTPPQSAITVPAADEELEFVDVPNRQVGDAATSLFAWQREGVIASTTTRPIAGDVARRSYERYLKSFEFPIPERFNSTVKSTSSTSSGTR